MIHGSDKNPLVYDHTTSVDGESLLVISGLAATWIILSVTRLCDWDFVCASLKVFCMGGSVCLQFIYQSSKLH